MPTTSKVLIPIITVVTLAFIWLATAVLETRHNWHKKIAATPAELKPADPPSMATQVEKVKGEVDLLVRGDDEARELFKKFVKEEIHPLASEQFKKVFDDKVAAGLDALPAFVVALDSFVDSKALEAYRQAVENLNNLQKSPAIEETQLGPLILAFEVAERDLDQQFKNLDQAFQLFLGETGQTGGIRAMGDRRVEGVYKGLGVDIVRSAIIRVGEIIAQQRAIYVTMLSDGAKNETLLRDKVASTADQASQIKKAADGAEKERDERQRELDEEKARHAREKVLLAEWEDKRDKSIAALAALQKQFDDTQARCIELTKFVRSKEIELDQKRGVRTVILTPDGIKATGEIKSIDEKTGLIRVDLGRKAGVQNGSHLHVYRSSPQAKYLGILEVSETDTDGSSGLMLKEYRQVLIKVGDSVATEIVKRDRQ